MLSSLGSYLLVFSTKFNRFLVALRAALTTPEEDMSIFEELWQYFSEKYFSVRFEEHSYQHINLGSNTMLSAQLIIVSLFVGIIIAAAFSLFQKRTLGDLVRALDRENANTPDKAITLEQIGLLRNASIKEALRHGTSLRRVVRCVEEDAYLQDQQQKKAEFEAAAEAEGQKGKKKWKDVPYRYDFFKDHFYIPEDLIYGAAVHFDKKGTDPLRFVITVIGCVIFASLICWLLPDMLQLVDNFISIFNG